MKKRLARRIVRRQVIERLESALVNQSVLLYRYYLVWRYRWVEGYRAVADPLRLAVIDPNSVHERTQRRFGGAKTRYYGYVCGGQWDLHRSPFDESPKVKGIIEHFSGGQSWEKTTIYQFYRAKGESHENTMRLLDRYDQLALAMKKRYRSSFELPQSELLEEVCVAVGRDGDVLFCGAGSHRLALAKVIAVPEIPVRVAVRHVQWQETRERIAQEQREGIHNSTGLAGWARHPDLADVIGGSVLRKTG